MLQNATGCLVAIKAAPEFSVGGFGRAGWERRRGERGATRVNEPGGHSRGTGGR